MVPEGPLASLDLGTPERGYAGLFMARGSGSGRDLGEGLDSAGETTYL